MSDTSETIQPLHNTYFIMRHGRSEANDQSLIQSAPETSDENAEDNSKAKNSLTEEGREQVRKSIERAKTDYNFGSLTLLVSSDFARTKETAEIVQNILGTDTIEFSAKLRERSFGAFDGTHTENYEKIWKADRDSSALIQECEVESVNDVQKRVLSCVQDLESHYSEKTILLISHGDTLQILQSAIQGIAPSEHRSLPEMQNAEIRKLN